MAQPSPSRSPAPAPTHARPSTRPARGADVWRLAEVVERPLDALRAGPVNARTHSPAQRRMLARSIAAFGFTSPVLVDAEGRIVAGHGRVAAARELGMATVPTVRLDHLTPAQCRALALADNRIAERAGWDRDLLRIEIDGLLELDPGVDLTLTGFEDAEIDILLHPPAASPARAPARMAEPRPDPDPGSGPGPVAAVSRPGDCWMLGRHALLCAAPQAVAWPLLPGDGPAAMLLAAPPQSGAGLDPGSGPGLGPGLREVLAAAVAASRPGALHYLGLDWRALDALAAAAAGLYAGRVDLCVWDRGAAADSGTPSPHLASPYRPRHALVAVYRTPGAAPGAGGRPGRRRDNLWRHPPDAAPPLAAGGLPERLAADAILDATAAGEIVLDPWGGPATLPAAERTGRRARLAAADPRRADRLVRRWQAATGGTATLAASGGDPAGDPGGDPGGSFDAVAARRGREAGDAR